MELIADSGSTKTDWLLKNGEQRWVFHTQGMNPCLMSEETIMDILTYELLPKLTPIHPYINTYRFYGAGCTEDSKSIIERALKKTLCGFLASDADVEVGSDLLGAAKFLCGDKEGIACILGTGSNSCLYDGDKIVKHTPALGYILGDEGGAAYIGKRLIGDCLKGQMSKDICRLFFEETGLTIYNIINKVYKEEMPNRFLGQVSQFCQRHLDIVEIREFVIDCFCQFFQRNIFGYCRPELEVHFIGSIAAVYEGELREAGDRCVMKVGRIVRKLIEPDGEALGTGNLKIIDN